MREHPSDHSNDSYCSNMALFPEDGQPKMDPITAILFRKYNRDLRYHEKRPSHTDDTVTPCKTDKLATMADGRNSDADLSPYLFSLATDYVFLEFTSRCNLSCVYCRSNQPDFERHDLDLTHFDDLVSALRSRKVRALSVNGAGETTILKGWHHYCGKLIKAGFQLSIISNFARELSWEEAETFADFNEITISCDTVDLQLFRKLRRGGDLRMILLNMNKIRAAALQSKKPGPLFLWNSILSDKSIKGLYDWVAMGIGTGVKKFHVTNLVVYPDVSKEITVRHFSDMAVEDKREGIEVFIKARELAEANGA
ncbi:MAG: radical SAM protein [Syntrophobacteraceae bacterium]